MPILPGLMGQPLLGVKDYAVEIPDQVRRPKPAGRFTQEMPEMTVEQPAEQPSTLQILGRGTRFRGFGGHGDPPPRIAIAMAVLQKSPTRIEDPRRTFGAPRLLRAPGQERDGLGPGRLPPRGSIRVEVQRHLGVRGLIGPGQHQSSSASRGLIPTSWAMRQA
jgi:hypothetical protein